MKTHIKKILPPTLREPLHRARLRWRAWRHHGQVVHCACCGGDYQGFLPMREGSSPRPNVECPGCGSAERHRMLIHYLRRQTPLFFPKGTRILYIAPMRGIRQYLKSLPGVEYLGADLESALAEEHFDLQNIPHSDSSFDFCICSHTLAHIPDDLKALRELRRVLSPNGRLLVMERIHDRPDTYQNDQARNSADRLLHYQQADRHRIYGKDFSKRLASAGFDVRVEYPAANWHEDRLLKEGIDPEEGVFIATAR